MNPIPISDVQKRAIEVAKEQNPNSTAFNVTSTIPNVLDGYMVTVTCNNNGTEEDVFVLVTANNARRYYDVEELSNIVGTYASRPLTQAELFWDRVGLPGILALLIFLTIAIILITSKGTATVPEVLNSAFSIVIGFYFGRFINRP